MSVTGRLGLCLCLTLLVLASANGASALDPQSFADVASGVVFIQATGCGKGGITSGSGFLVGTSVVVTAAHVVKGCHFARVLVKEKKWIVATHWTTWSDNGANLDVATLKLTRPVSDAWIFRFRRSQVPIGAYIAALGHPLGEAVSMVNGRVVARRAGRILLRILGAQGLSGGPIVDPNGSVVALVNQGIGDPGAITGAITGDNLICYDFSSRWGGWRKTLCGAYPSGGIDDCG